jgi:hypothetical protein
VRNHCNGFATPYGTLRIVLFVEVVECFRRAATFG